MINKDILMIAALRQNARATIGDMSRQTGIPSSTLFDRLNSKDSSIKKHTALVDFGKLGYHTIAKIALKTKKEQREALKEFLANHNNLNSVYRINNGFDFFAEGIFRNVKEMSDFMEEMREKFSIEREELFYIIEELKKEAFLSDVERAKNVEEGR